MDNDTHGHAGPTGDATSPERRFGRLRIDPARHLVLVDNQEVTLTRLEFSLLLALTDDPGTLATPRELLERVWGYAWLGDDHVVETHIGRLRAKLGENARHPRYIHTVRGRGYRFAPRGSEPHLHHVTYDASLVIVAIEPAEHGVLGWHHSDLIGRCVVFHAPQQSIDQAAALSIVRSLSAVSTQAGPSVIGAFDIEGTQHVISLLMCFTPSPDGEFEGLVAHLLLDGGQAARDGSWPDGGHGSSCPLAS